MSIYCKSDAAEAHSILIVDLCGTLILENTTRGFTQWLASRGGNRLLAAMGLSRTCSVLTKCTQVDIARRIQVLSTKGLSKSLLYEEGSMYVANRLVDLANNKVIEAINRAKALSQSVYLATASLDPIANAVMAQLQVDGIVCSKLEYNREGVCTGRLALDLLGRKWSALSSLLPTANRDITLYTDNPEDEDLMEQASQVYFLGDKATLSASMSTKVV